MKKLGFLFTIMGISLFGIMSTAYADPDPVPFPSATPANCAAVNGVYSTGTNENGNLYAQCVVTVESTAIVPASHKNQAWTVEVETSEVVTYRTTRNEVPSNTHVHGGVTIGDVIGCWNQNGNAIGGFESNKNCLPGS